MSQFKVMIVRTTYESLKKYVYTTKFQYETGGVLIGYKWLGIFWVMAFTFSHSHRGVNATKMTFVLNGEEHTAKMQKIRKRYIFRPKLIGVWHSHTMEDEVFSLQDKKSNKLLVSRIGEMLSLIVIPQKKNNIRMIPYYITESNHEFLCKIRIVDFFSCIRELFWVISKNKL